LGEVVIAPGSDLPGGVEFDFEEEVVAADVALGQEDREGRHFTGAAVVVPKGDVLAVTKVTDGTDGVREAHCVAGKDRFDHFQGFFDLFRGVSDVGGLSVCLDAGLKYKGPAPRDRRLPGRG